MCTLPMETKSTSGSVNQYVARTHERKETESSSHQLTLCKDNCPGEPGRAWSNQVKGLKSTAGGSRRQKKNGSQLPRAPACLSQSLPHRFGTCWAGLKAE